MPKLSNHSTRKSILKSMALAVPVAVVAVGAADCVELPGPFQHLISYLDIAALLPIPKAFTDQTRIFDFWVLPINMAFYAALLFLLSFYHLRKGELVTPLLEKLVDGVPSALPAASGANLPTLSRVLDRDELGQRLVVLLGSQWGGGLRVERMHLLKWRSPKRCLIEFLLQTDMIGKVYAKDRADVYRFMEALNRAGFDRAAQFSIPQPIGYLPDLYLLLQAKVRGVKAKEIFLTGDDPARAMASEQCAGWLARFHAAAPQWGPVLRTEKFLRRCEAKRRHLSDQGADLYFKSSQLFEELEASRASLADTPMCAGHGDFGYHQVIFAEGRTVVCDWDVYDVCDPARDVARFIVALKRLALKNLGSIRELDGAAEIFLKKYRDSGGPSLPEEQVRFFNAAYCLWEAQWEAKRRRPEWHERAEAMLDEGLRALGEQKTLRVPELATGSVSKPRGGTRA